MLIIFQLTLYPHSASSTAAHMLCCHGSNSATMSSGCFLTAHCVWPVFTWLGPHCTPMNNSVHAHLKTYLFSAHIQWLFVMHAYQPCRCFISLTWCPLPAVLLQPCRAAFQITARDCAAPGDSSPAVQEGHPSGSSLQRHRSRREAGEAAALDLGQWHYSYKVS